MYTATLNFREKYLDNFVVVGDTVNLGQGHDLPSQTYKTGSYVPGVNV